MTTIPEAKNPFAAKGLATDALTRITALAQAKGKSANCTKPLCDLPEAEPVRMAIKAAMEAGCQKEHLRDLMKAAFGGDLAGQANTTVGQAALFPAMEPELAMAGAPEIPDHEEGMQRAIAKAQAICCAPRPIEKSQVGAYTRTHQGKVIQVHEYTTRRQNSMNATKQAHATSDEALKSRSPEAHQNAVASHLEALRHHTEAHELSPTDVAGDHKELMEHHRAAARWHSEKAKGATGAYGTEKVEARGQERPATKAHHEASTRVVNGQVVQVKPYDDHRKAAEKASKSASKVSADALFEKKGVEHTHATQAHYDARDAHIAAAHAAPSFEEAEGHKRVAAHHHAKGWEHEVYHREAQHKASLEESSKPSQGLQTAHLTQHDEDYKGGGRGYLGHEFRGDHTDKALVEAANHHGLDQHELETYAKSRPGRHDMDATTFLMGKVAPQKPDESDEAVREREIKAHGRIPHEKLVEHFHKAIGKAKGENWFKEDAEERRNQSKG